MHHHSVIYRLKHHLQKIIAAIIRLSILGTYLAFAIIKGWKEVNITLLTTIYNCLTSTSRGMIYLLLIYACRPIIFFPVGLLSIINGSIFGVWRGFLLASIGENLSANIGYLLGRFFGKKFLDNDEVIEIKFFKQDFKMNTLLAVFLSRLSFLPDDIMNYGWWYIRIKRIYYFVWSILGNLFFTFLNVLIGSQITNIQPFVISGDISQLHPQRHIIAIAAAVYGLFLIIGLLITKYHNKLHPGHEHHSV